MNLKKKYQKSWIWITGASSGIGKALALEAARQGASLVLSSRNRQALESVRTETGLDDKRCRVVPLDVTQIDKIKDIADSVLENIPQLDYLFHVAGVSQRSRIDETNFEVDRKIMEINYFGTIALTKAVLPAMVKQGGGWFLVISSVFGKFGFPHRSAYSASKHALHGFFETLKLEYKSEKVGVTIAVPGSIQSQVSVNALTGDGTPYGIMDPGLAKGVPADRAARIMLRAVARKRREVLVGKVDVYAVLVKKYLPGLFFSLATRVRPT